ncbi:RNA polymerase sigma-70 factor (ECF subfamily) [Streptomyces sp. TLI_235]|nr:sigma-70 family RNA polymerase sigma factor [Streptomyces sp. TLI_235]PBC78024.1 RNA polymerase sigma-70 factor (ECF subfamily) [Streptomyces sp. TLI_235]
MDGTLRGTPRGTPHLIEAAKAGDRDAWAELYRRYRGPVLAFLTRRTGNRALAEDLTQDTFVRAMACIDGYRWTGKDMGAWIFTIARNIMFDHDKRRATRSESTVAAVADSDAGICVEDLVLSLVEAERVFAALATLTEHQRTALTLRYWDDLSSREVADAIGIRVGAVKTLTYRARSSLRRTLATGAAERCAAADRCTSGERRPVSARRPLSPR